MTPFPPVRADAAKPIRSVWLGSRWVFRVHIGLVGTTGHFLSGEALASTMVDENAANGVQHALPRPKQAGTTELERRFKEGLALYSASNYPAAIVAFSDAVTLWETEGGDMVIRGAILFNLACAYDRAAEVEQSLRYLRLARETYLRYLREANDGFPYDDVQRVKVRVEEIERALATQSAATSSATATPNNSLPLTTASPVTRSLAPPPAPVASEGKGPLQPQALNASPSQLADRRADALQKRQQRRSLRFKISGGTLLSLGASFTALGIFGSVAGAVRDQAIRSGKAMPKQHDEPGLLYNKLAYVGWGAGPALAGAGLALLLVDRARTRQLKATAAGPSVQLSFWPLTGALPSLTLSGRF